MSIIDENSKLSFSIMTYAKIGAFILITVVPSLFAIDGYYAHASDVEYNSDQIIIAKASFEQSQNEMRLDIIDSRIDRELDKTPEIRDNRKVEKLRKQYNRLEQRQQVLDAEQIKRDMDR